MEIQVQLSKEDYLHFIKLLTLGVYKGKPAQSQQAHFMPVIMIFMMAVSVIAILLFSNHKAIEAAVIFVFGFGLSWTLYDYLIKLRIKRANENFDPDPEDVLFSVNQHTFTKEEIRQANEIRTAIWQRESIKLVFEDSQLFLFFMSGMRAFIFPKNQLSAEEMMFLKSWAQGIPFKECSEFNPE